MAPSGWRVQTIVGIVLMMSRRRSLIAFDVSSVLLWPVFALVWLMLHSARPDLAVFRAFAGLSGSEFCISIGGDYSRYRRFVVPIVLQSRGNGSQSHPAGPVYISSDSRIGRKPQD